MLHCDLRVRWKVASDLRFRAAISEPKTPSFCGIPGDLAQSTRKSLAIAIVRFWCAKIYVNMNAKDRLSQLISLSVAILAQEKQHTAEDLRLAACFSCHHPPICGSPELLGQLCRHRTHGLTCRCIGQGH